MFFETFSGPKSNIILETMIRLPKQSSFSNNSFRYEERQNNCQVSKFKRVLIEDGKKFMSLEKFCEVRETGPCFLKVPKLVGLISGATVLFTSTQRRSSKSSNFLVSYIKNMLKDQLFRTSGLQFNKWLFGPENLSRLLPGTSFSKVLTDL